VVQGPNPGSDADILGGVAAAGYTLWAVGHYAGADTNRLTLIERHDER
jgi:hypothetical protein